MHALFLFLLVCLSGFPVSAQEPGSSDPVSAAPQTRIEADEKAGIVRIIVEGREVAHIDASGLHVRGDIEFGGILTDTGQDDFDRDGPPGGQP